MPAVEIRKLALTDREPVDAILMQSFPGINPAGIVERELALAPETSFIAVDEGMPVGLVCAIQYGAIAYIGPMAVVPDRQGKGIGRLLFEHLTESLERRGCSTMMLDATEAGEPLYRRFGFVEWARTFDLVREPGGGITSPPAVDDIERVVQMDRALFTEDRTAMLRRLLEQEGAALYSNSQGYLISQTRVLGPFAAWNRQAAARLLDQALRSGAVASRVLAPVENPEAESLLKSRGFQVQREVKHMRRGLPVAMRRDLMYGLASFALG